MLVGKAKIVFEKYLEKHQEMVYEVGIQIKHKNITIVYSFVLASNLLN